VGSFRERIEAEQRAAALERMGHACRIVKVNIPGRGRMFRVLTGGYGGYREAAQAMAALRGQGLPADSCVVKRPAAL
jgi:cell division protein FtsN